MTLIVDEPMRGGGKTWECEFVVDTWDDTAMHRLRMDMRRGYMHVSPRTGSHGARTNRGADTAWMMRPAFDDG